MLFDWDGDGRTRLPGACMKEWIAVGVEWDDIDRLLIDYETKGGE
jgi:hypothetical protein